MSLFVLGAGAGTLSQPPAPAPDGASIAGHVIMIEQPPKPDVPKAPDVVNQPPPVNRPVPPGEPEDDRPDIHPVPPPTDPAPPVI